MPLDELAAISKLAHDREIPLHMDGARIFNAAVALGVPASEIAKYADSVTFCVSKGLAAPVGSVLCGSRDFIARAYRGRKIIGGAHAAGRHHRRRRPLRAEQQPRAPGRRPRERPAARRQACVGLPGVSIDRDEVRPTCSSSRSADRPRARRRSRRKLREQDVLCGAAKDGAPVMRLVTHYGIERRTSTA